MKFAASALILSALLVAAPAAAQQPDDAASPPSPAPHTLQLGVNLRTDSGPRALRADIGWRTGELGALLVVDPFFWTDAQSSTDLTAHWLTDSLQPFAGWRLNTIGVLDDTQLQHNLLLGVGLPFPTFFEGLLGGQWGLEMATTLVQHGGGLPTQVIGFEYEREYVDLVNFSMYARFHFNLEVL